jgi:hypothetical protein
MEVVVLEHCTRAGLSLQVRFAGTVMIAFVMLLFVSVARAACLTSAQLGSYDTLKNNILIKRFGMKEGMPLHFGTALLTGLITTTATNPVSEY